VGGDDRGHDRQAEPRAAAVAGARVLGAGEPLERAALQLRWEAGTVVGDSEHDLLARRDDGHLDAGAGLGMHSGVGEQVGEHLTQPVGVADHDGGLRRDVQPHRPVRCRGLRVGSRVGGQQRHVDRLAA